MRFHGKLMLRVVTAFAAVTCCFILLHNQLTRNGFIYKTDGFDVLDLLGRLGAVAMDLRPDFSLTWGNRSATEQTQGLEAVRIGATVPTDDVPTRLNNSQPNIRVNSTFEKLRFFVTAAPNNSEVRFRVNRAFKPSTCASSLHYRLLNSSWSAQYYHPTIQMIMTSANINETEYNRLKNYHMPFGFYHKDRLTFRELKRVLDLFSTEESIFEFTDRPRPPCVSCAVVGNGGILNGSRMGEEIDSHDMVFRVNNCIRRGHETDVGRRTTHYVFMDRSLIHTPSKDIPNDKGIKWVFLPCRRSDYKYITEAAKGSNKRQKLRVNATNVRLLHPDFVRYTHKLWVRPTLKSFRPSTGAMMFFTALHAGCDKLSVYGMGFNRNYTGYYYDTKFKIYSETRRSHDFRRETRILKELDEAGVIKWYKRDVQKFIL